MVTENAWDIVKDMLRMGSALYRNGDRIAGVYGLNQQQFIVLSEIVNSGPINQKQLVGEMIIEKSSLSKIVKKLRSLGLVTSTSSPDDGRAILLGATQKGRTVWKECMGDFHDWQVNWAGSLTKEEVRQTINVLERLKGLPL
ncbi:MarR family winged helix-turn-helix transcriptional regulator [Chloroflexota bacterium]